MLAMQLGAMAELMDAINEHPQASAADVGEYLQPIVAETLRRASSIVAGCGVRNA